MKTVSRVFVGLILLILYAPLFVMLFFSFNSGSSTAVFEGFSLEWYQKMFADDALMNALKNTLILALLSSVTATVLGTAAAVAIHRMKRGVFRSSVMTVTNVPMMNPDIVTGVSLMLLFVFVGTLVGSGEKLGFHTILIAHITFNLPYVILNVLPKLRQMDVFLTEAALDLGATPMQSFFKVELPAIMPGVFSGLLMAFTLSIDDFVISYYTSDNFETLPIRIYTMVKKPITPKVFSMTSLLFISVLVLMILFNVFQAKAEKKHGRAK